MKQTLLIAVMLLAACGDEETTDELGTETEVESELESETEADNSQVEGSVAAISFDSVPAYFGGAQIAAGLFAVELLPQSNGAVKAFVSKADGTAVENAVVEVSMQGTDGEPHDVELAWDAAAGAYIGMMDAAKPSAGPVAVTVEADGVEGASADATINVAGTPVYGGHTLLLGNVAAEVVTDAEGAVMVNAQGPDGALTADAVELSVSVQADDGEKYEVPLAWDAEANVYAGLLPDDVRIASGTLDLKATLAGVTYSSGLPQIGVSVPAHEGDLVAAGDLSIELVAKPDGGLQAFVTNAAGEAVADAGGELKLGIAGMESPVDFAWNADVGAYTCVLPPDVDISTRPLNLSVNVNGQTRHGGMAAATGRSLGVAWRSRLESGAGGAIPVGHARRLHMDTDFRARAGARARGVARVNLNADGQARGVRGQAGRAEARVRAGAMIPMVSVMTPMVQVATPMVNVRAPMVTVPMVNVPSPMVGVRTGGSAMGSSMASGGTAMAGASAMGGVSVMLGL